MLLCRTILGALAAFGALAAHPSIRGDSDAVTIPLVAHGPVIDGRMDDDAWRQAVKLDGFVQIRPGENIAPSRQTTVWLLRDASAIFIAFVADDDPAAVRARLAQRDHIDDDDSVGVYLDTFDDRRRAYYLFFNPLGVQADGIYAEGAAAPDLSVDVVMQSKGTLTPTGYVVEARIPLSSLRYEVRPNAVWGLHVQRVIRRFNNEVDSWRAVSRNLSTLLDQAGQIVGPGDAPAARLVTVIPSLLATGEGHVTADPGATVAVALSPKSSISATINPDFAQVEADQLQLTANQRFPLFYQEKRPFFLDGVELFDTPMSVIHTRAIANPAAATKLIGTFGRLHLGVIGGLDDRLAGRTGVAAGRASFDFRTDSSAAVAATRMDDGKGQSSMLISADTRTRLDPQTVVVGQIVTTSTTASGATSRDGVGYLARVEHITRRTEFKFAQAGDSPGYATALGYTRQVNFNSSTLTTTYKSEPRPGSRLVQWSATDVAFAQWNWQRQLTYAYIYPQLTLVFPRQTVLNVTAYRDFERIFEQEFGPARTSESDGPFLGGPSRDTVYAGYTVNISTVPNPALTLSGGIAPSRRAAGLTRGYRGPAPWS